MQKITSFLILAILTTATATAQLRIGGKSINVNKAAAAVKDVATAVTLTDADIADLCRQSIIVLDSLNTVAPADDPYTVRLNKLVANVAPVGDHTFNFKVYLVTDINAFACADGSIRIFSSLMDIMTDDELVAIIGHEIGHIVNTDTKEAMRSAYLASAARNVAGSTNTTVGKLANSELGALSEALLGAQFSQKQEYEADQYGYNFCVALGYDKYGMANSLQKLVELANGGGAKASAVSKMFSTHPDSEKRAAVIRKKADTGN